MSLAHAGTSPGVPRAPVSMSAEQQHEQDEHAGEDVGGCGWGMGILNVAGAQKIWCPFVPCPSAMSMRAT